MCGIVGTYKTRTPKGFLTGIWTRGTESDITHYNDLSVGFRRLPIVGGSEGQQPAIGKRYVVWMNGEVYNYKEWSKSSSDTQAVLEWFEQEGINPERFNGMFTILVYDKQTKTPYLIRDRFGIKQIYYKRVGEGYQFASTTVPLQTGRKNDLVERMFKTTLLNWTDDTIHSGVKKLPKGSILNLRTGWIQRWWTWSEMETFEGSYEEAKEELSLLLRRAIKSQDRPGAGTLLSGGIDSGTIAALMDLPYTFNVSFPKELDESLTARELSRGRHYSFHASNEAKQYYINQAVQVLDDPRLSNSWVNYAVYELASKFTNVILEGAGGDELFMGYTWRYGVEDYWNIVNKTGVKDDIVEQMFRDTFDGSYKSRRLFDLDHFLEGLFIVADRMAMAHTVENRVPFMDNNLVDFALSLPRSFLYDKKILKDVSPIPEHIKKLKKKGFASPEYLNDKQKEQKKWVKLHT